MEEDKELVGWVSIDVERELVDVSVVVVLVNADVWLGIDVSVIVVGMKELVV